MTINFTAGQTLLVNRAFAQNTLSSETYSFIPQTLTILGYLDSVPAVVQEVGNLTDPALSYIRLLPASTNICYNNGVGATLFFNSDSDLNNSFVVSGKSAQPAFLDAGFSNILYVDWGSTVANPDGSSQKPFSTIQAAINTLVTATDAASINRRNVIFIAPGSYDEDLTIGPNIPLALLGLGPWNLGTFTASTGNPSGTLRNITKTYPTANINSVNDSLDIGTMIQFGDGFANSFAQAHCARISGKITLTGGASGTTNNFSCQAMVFGTPTSLDASTAVGTLNIWFTESRFEGAVTGVTTTPGFNVNTIDRCRFGGALSTRTYTMWNDSAFNANVTIGVAPTITGALNNSPGIRGCYFPSGITFSGPASSLVVDATTNYWVKTNSVTLAGGATKIIISDTTA